MSKAQPITMTVQGVSLTFEPNKTAFNNLINEMTLTNKMAPMATYLSRIVSGDCKAQLVELMESYPGCEMQIVEKVNEIYSPKLEIEVKN